MLSNSTDSIHYFCDHCSLILSFFRNQFINFQKLLSKDAISKLKRLSVCLCFNFYDVNNLLQLIYVKIKMASLNSEASCTGARVNTYFNTLKPNICLFKNEVSRIKSSLKALQCIFLKLCVCNMCTKLKCKLPIFRGIFENKYKPSNFLKHFYVPK